METFKLHTSWLFASQLSSASYFYFGEDDLSNVAELKLAIMLIFIHEFEK